MPICPKCDAPLSVVAMIDGDSRMSFEVTPEHGQMLTARGLGGMIESFAKLWQAIGRDMRVTTEVYVETISCDPITRAIRLDFVITRAQYKRDIGKETSGDGEQR